MSTGTHKLLTEGEHLELRGITKEQSGSYECIAANDISNTDVRTVQVTVNCKGLNFNARHNKGPCNINNCKNQRSAPHREPGSFRWIEVNQHKLMKVKVALSFFNKQQGGVVHTSSTDWQIAL